MFSIADFNEPEHPAETTEESDVDDVFSTRAFSLTTATPSSSYHETFQDFRQPLHSDTDQRDHPAQRPVPMTHGQRSPRSSSASYPRRIAIGESSIPSTASGNPQYARTEPNDPGGGGSERERNPRDSFHWEPDETVNACRICNRRFTAFMRRHHCRYLTPYVLAALTSGSVVELYVIDALRLVILFLDIW